MSYERAEKQYRKHLKNEPTFRLPKLKTGQYLDIRNRNLSKATCERYEYQVGEFTGTIDGEIYNKAPCHIATYCSSKNKRDAQKIRLADKVFTWAGDTPLGKLFGIQAFQPREDNFIIVTEGEIDAMSIYEMTGYAAVSLSHGAGTQAKSNIKQNLEWLSRWKYVIFWFDNDEPGLAAVQEVALLFDRDKAFYVKTPAPYKDVNDLAVANKREEIKNLIWSAQPIRAFEMVSASSHITEDEDNNIVCAFPWRHIEEKLQGVRLSSLYSIGAGTGIGKSTFVLDIICTAASLGIESSFFSLEDSLSDTKKSLISWFEQQNLKDAPSGVINPLLDKHKDALEKISINKCGVTELNIDTLIKIIKLEARSRNSQIIVLDNLTILTEGMDYQKIGELIAKLRALTIELNICLFLLNHLTTPAKGSKPHEEGGRVYENQFRGHRAIINYSTHIIGLERNKQAEDDEAYLTIVRVLKGGRKGQSTGIAGYVRLVNSRYKES